MAAGESHLHMRDRMASRASRGRRSLTLYTVVRFTIALVTTLIFVAIARAVIEGHADAIDRAIALAIHRVDTPTLDRVMIVVTESGAGATIAVAIAIVAAWCLHEQRSRLAVVLVMNGVAEEATNWLLKELFARNRPALFEEIMRPTSYSFPSGHAMSAVAAYGALAVVLIAMRPGWRPVVIPISVLWILAIGFSRVYLGVHWPSDVIAGFAAGAPFVLVTIQLTRAVPAR
jgi:membrane-associated phospholipid phosphatase